MNQPAQDTSRGPDKEAKESPPQGEPTIGGSKVKNCVCGATIDIEAGPGNENPAPRPGYCACKPRDDGYGDEMWKERDKASTEAKRKTLH